MGWSPRRGRKIRRSELADESQFIILFENSEIFRQAQDDVEDGFARDFCSGGAEWVAGYQPTVSIQ
jgi:hypothetical protein